MSGLRPSHRRPSRRSVLAAGAATTSLLLTGPVALTGCTSSARAPEEPDPLASPARRAEADAALAAAVTRIATPTDAGLAAAAGALAADRMAHAATLQAELRRIRPVPSTTAGPVAPPLVTPDLASARATLTQAVHMARDEAAGLVDTLPGYRAALLASVAACCATHAALLS
ncbi:MAG: hypothetical protein ACRDQ9_06385 [Pseudonocardiaceae bacterium]